MVLKFEEIKELIDLVADHRLAGVELVQEEFRLKIDGYKPAKQTIAAAAPAAPAVAPAPPAALSPPPAAAPPTAGAVAGEQAPPSPEEGSAHPDAHLLTSPIVGTFYRSPNPEAPPFVEIGSRVKKGQALCIVEAMKLMNEIEADTDGVIVDVFPQNAQPVEFGEPLFAIKAD